MHFEKADYLHRCHLRDSGYIGELPYADKELSMQTPEGDWLLRIHVLTLVKLKMELT